MAGWTSRRILTPLLIMAAVVTVGIVVWQRVDVTQPSSSPVTPQRQAAEKTPRWIKGCFVRWAPPLPGDAAYRGLKPRQATVLAPERGEQIVVIGFAGRCNTVGGNVAYLHPVGLLLDRGSLRGGIPRNAIVVFADSNPAATMLS